MRQFQPRITVYSNSGIDCRVIVSEWNSRTSKLNKKWIILSIMNLLRVVKYVLNLK